MTPEQFFERISTYRSELIRAGVRRLGVYGSVARGEAGPDSDVDILADSNGCRTFTSSPLCVTASSKFSATQSTSRLDRR